MYSVKILTYVPTYPSMWPCIRSETNWFIFSFVCSLFISTSLKGRPDSRLHLELISQSALVEWTVKDKPAGLTPMISSLIHVFARFVYLKNELTHTLRLIIIIIKTALHWHCVAYISTEKGSFNLKKKKEGEGVDGYLFKIKKII